jgi:hypothetical protein
LRSCCVKRSAFFSLSALKKSLPRKLKTTLQVQRREERAFNVNVIVNEQRNVKAG